MQHRWPEADLLRTRLGSPEGRLVDRAGTAQAARDAVVPLVACVLVEKIVELRPGRLDRPGLGEGRRVVDRIFVEDRVGIDQGRLPENTPTRRALLTTRGRRMVDRPTMARLRRGASPTRSRFAGGSFGPTLMTVNDVPSGRSVSRPWFFASFQVLAWQSVMRISIGLLRFGASGQTDGAWPGRGWRATS